MPVLLDERVVTLEFADLYARRPITRPDRPHARSHGYHVSGILSAIAKKVGWLKNNEPFEEDLPMIVALGFAWEEFVFSMLPDSEWQPGEMCVDEIYMNCDGVGMYNEVYPKIDEAKSTLKSAGDVDPTTGLPMLGEEFIKATKWRMWQHQGREYCFGYGPRVETWHVCHLRGNYREWPMPIYKQYTVRFTDQECEQTHGMLVKNKHLAVPE